MLSEKMTVVPYSSEAPVSVGNEHDDHLKEIASLMKQLEHEKQMNKKMSSNVKKMKKKLIDVSSLLELHDGMKKKMEEQRLEINRLHQLLKNQPSSVQSVSSSVDKATIQKLTTEKQSLEAINQNIREQLATSQKEKRLMEKQLEMSEEKLKRSIASSEQVDQLRGLLTQAQKELVELRQSKGFSFFSDFARSKPSEQTTEIARKRDCKSIAVGTDPILLMNSYSSSLMGISNENPPLGSQFEMDYSPPSSQPCQTIKPPAQKRKFNSTSTDPFQSSKKLKSKNQEQTDEVITTPRDISKPSQPVTITSTLTNEPVSPHLPNLCRNVPTKDSPTFEIPPLVEIPEISPLCFEKRAEQSVENYIEELSMDFIQKYEQCISDRAFQSLVLGELNKTSKYIWKNYEKNKSEIVAGICNTLIKLICNKASRLHWNLFIIFLDNLDLYSFNNNVLLSIINEAYEKIHGLFVGNITENSYYSRLSALLAGISTISNVRFARLDVCMFSKAKELFCHILRLALQNERDPIMIINGRFLKLLVIIASSNKRILQNGFDNLSAVDISVRYILAQFWQYLSTNYELLNAEQKNLHFLLEKLNKVELGSDGINCSIDETCSKLLQQLEVYSREENENFECDKTQLCNAFLLLAHYINDWNWIYNELILGKLWNIMVESMTKQSIRKVSLVLAVISNLCLMRSQSNPNKLQPTEKEWDLFDVNHDGLVQLLEKFKTILLLDNVFPLDVIAQTSSAMVEIILNRLTISQMIIKDTEKQSLFESNMMSYLGLIRSWMTRNSIQGAPFDMVDKI